MCGIICLISTDPIDLNVAINCLHKLKPRGPDAVSYQSIKSQLGYIFMGFTRLAIQDTSDAAMQPFCHDNNYVCCNGEIYNHQELSHQHGISLTTSCDCEIILPLYQKVGLENMVKDCLDAEFAMIIYDNHKDTIYAVRDRYGVTLVLWLQSQSSINRFC